MRCKYNLKNELCHLKLEVLKIVGPYFSNNFRLDNDTLRFYYAERLSNWSNFNLGDAI